MDNNEKGGQEGFWKFGVSVLQATISTTEEKAMSEKSKRGVEG